MSNKNKYQRWSEAVILLNKLSLKKLNLSPSFLEYLFTDSTLVMALNKVNSEEELNAFIHTQHNIFLENDQRSETKMDSAEVIGQGLTSFYRWISTGFKITNSLEFNRRMNICKQCPFYSDSNKQKLYSLLDSFLGKSPICTKCGCQLFKKARMLHASCPLKHPTDPTINLWSLQDISKKINH